METIGRPCSPSPHGYSVNNRTRLENAHHVTAGASGKRLSVQTAHTSIMSLYTERETVFVEDKIFLVLTICIQVRVCMHICTNTCTQNMPLWRLEGARL